MRQTTTESRIRPLREAFGAALGHAAAAAICIGGLWWGSNAQLKTAMREELTQVAGAAAAVVDGDLHRALTIPEQMDGADYNRCIAPLRLIYAHLKGVKYLYTVAPAGHELHFVLDTAAQGDNDGDGVEDRSDLGSLFEAENANLWTALREGHSTADSEPYTDKWGTFVSGYAPIRDSSGRVVGAVGADMTAETYVGRLAAARRWALFGLLPAAALSISAGLVTYQFRRNAQRDQAQRLQQEEALEAAFMLSRRAEDGLLESETRLKTIINSIQAGVILVDRETHVVADANPAALAMLGAPREQVVGAVCHRFICPTEHGHCPVTDCGQSVNSSERVLLAAGGREVPILKTVVPVSLRQREYLLESFVDISDRKGAERELAAHRERLEELVRERTEKLMEAERQVLHGEKLASVGRLAAGVAHEINTPIQYIGDNLHALADFYADIRVLVDKYRELVNLVAAAQVRPGAAAEIQAAEREHDLEFILEDAPKAISQGLEGVQRVANIVRAMKDFSHVQGGAASSVDLNRCLQSTLTVARNEYKYVADVATDFGALPNVECHANELSQVFLNMLVNAAHAIQDTGRRGQIKIATRLDGEQVEITFADTGVGIPEEIRSKIYEPFFTTKAVGRGTGQGLSIAHQIVVSKHGGQLTCESTVGVGTTFRIRIPVTVVAPPAQQS